MEDNSENIFVEFDYNNIVIVDPNRVINENGMVSERFVKQENLVMYANLECKMIPRTKLVLGESYDSANIVSLATINFLKQQDKTFLDNSWSDEVTGKGSLESKGDNQVNYKKSSLPEDKAISKTINSGGNPGSVNNGLLGIKSIIIKQNTSFVPTISVVLEDIKGRALFELGDNSPYAAFFNLPYPKFFLTLKGYYGKAIRYEIMLQKFTSRYSHETGNFIIDLNFLTYKYSILNEITMGQLLALPHMFKTTVTTTSTSNSNNGENNVKNSTTSKGMQMLSEVYNEYKVKGLIDNNLPEYTLMGLKAYLDNFAKDIISSFSQQNLEPLSNIKIYSDIIDAYYRDVFGGDAKTSWAKKYLDFKSFYVLKNGKYVYQLKDAYLEKGKDEEVKTELKKLIKDYTTKLLENKTFGTGGEYIVNKGGNDKTTPKSSEIFEVKDISYQNFVYVFNPNEIDIGKTWRVTKGTNAGPNSTQEERYKSDIDKIVLKQNVIVNRGGNKTSETREIFFIFDSGEKTDTFIPIITKIKKTLEETKNKIEQDITTALGEFIKKGGTTGIKFIPSLRNILSVFFANGEAFLRLLDEVHTDAWLLSTNEDRINSVLSKETKNANPDAFEGKNTPVYPWPSFIVKSSGQNAQGIYNHKYPGDPDYINQTKGNDYSIWPEVGFVEEFVNASMQIEDTPQSLPPTSNSDTDIERLSFNTIELPINNQVFSNKDTVRFLYEIYERIFLTANYSRFSRSVEKSPKPPSPDYPTLLSLVVEVESNNIITALGNNSPFLVNVLQKYQITSTTFQDFLRLFSNSGSGDNWQLFIRGEIVTPYIRSVLQNSQFLILKTDVLSKPLYKPKPSLIDVKKIVDFLKSDIGSEFDFTDLQPFINKDWCKNYLADGIHLKKNGFETKTTLKYHETLKTITNFDSETNSVMIRPIVNFLTEKNQSVIPEVLNSADNFFSEFYKDRPFDEQFITEGNVRYFNYSGFVNSNQTTSILNTPFFINALQEGVNNYKNNSTIPFISAAYLFLNSLPLSTLKEKYKTFDSDEDLGYIFASLKKFAGTHKLPYPWILKLGSIWYRYKTYVKTGNDILNQSWSGFSYINNYDPANNNPELTYYLTGVNSNYDIVLEKNMDFTGGVKFSSINVGFYPKLINDFNFFLTGEDLFKYRTDTEEIVFGVGNNTFNKVFDYNTNFIITSKDNIDSFDVYINNNYYGTDLNEIQINNQDDLNIIIIKTKEGLESKILYETTLTISDQLQSKMSIDGSPGLKTFLIDSAIISEFETFSITPWTSIIYSEDKLNTYILPSHGSFKNQAYDEITNLNSKLIQNVTGNTSIHNGSVRLFWAASQFGYFDVEKITKPTPSEYMKHIFSGQPEQENFSINREDVSYASIEEMFSVFDKDILDGFEKEFLKFCVSDTNIDVTVTSMTTNFQSLIKSILTVPYNDVTNNNDIEMSSEFLLANIQNAQISKINIVLDEFLKTDILFVNGNPSFFDKKLFYSFSNKIIIEPITWEFYTTTTPNALPVNGNSVTLIESKSTYSEAWKDLEVYVGFSNNEKLIYSNNGSYITDFFIDFNVAFTSVNIKKLAAIIKIYASQKLLQSLDSPTPKPPSSIEQNLIAYAEIKQGPIVTPTPSNIIGDEILNLYKTNNFNVVPILRDISGKTIYISPNKSLINNVGGNLTDDEIIRGIVDEVIIEYYGPNFSDPKAALQEYLVVNYVKIPNPTYVDTPTTNSSESKVTFKNSMDEYLNKSITFHDDITNDIFLILNKKLDEISITPEKVTESKIKGEQTKYELYDSFKAINDKWISGNDFKNKTLFEDVLLLDRASKNIGQEVIVDIYRVKDFYLSTIEPANSLLDTVRSIIKDSQFVIMNLPAYINFYNVQDVIKNPIPKAEGTLEFGNSLFGTFTNVDYRQSSSKMVCFYGGKASEHPNGEDNKNIRYKDDSFDIRRAQDNPLNESQTDKVDYAFSNKVVAFNVEFGPQNQSIFNGFTVGQDASLKTAEAYDILFQIRNEGSGKGAASQSSGLYNLYKKLSYKCSVNMLGNAMIQPTMYFNLRHIPMFSGPYMITSVNHTIGPGKFDTSFEGVRQAVASLPLPTDYLAVLKKSLISKSQELIKQKITGKASNGNIINNSSEVVSKATQELKIAESLDCGPSLNAKYKSYVQLDNRDKENSIFNFKEVKAGIDYVVSLTPLNNTEKAKLNQIIFCSFYLTSGNKNGFSSINNNFASIDLTSYWSNLTRFLNKNSYTCLTNDAEIVKPYAVFNTLADSIGFLASKWFQNMGQLSLTNKVLKDEEVLKFWVININVDKNIGIENYNKISDVEKKVMETKINLAINLFKTTQI